MVDYKTELQKLLRKLFQFDSADLDFGIYRIMNQKRDIIEKFIQEDLIEVIDEEYKKILSSNKLELENKLDELKKEILENLGRTAKLPNGEIKSDFKDLPLITKYLVIKKQLDKQLIREQEITEILSHVYNFFSRYYYEGDFISKRRYGKNAKYVIPYNGEVLLLHWANNDQYFIKTSEWFTKYTFKTNNYIINFKIKDTVDEISNVKADTKRFFVLANDFLDIQKSEINIYFTYRSLSNDEKKKFGSQVKQDDFNEYTITNLLLKIKEIGDKDVPHNKELFKQHLLKYTKRNTSDYFIHKNLKQFLENELDFYIKNEILSLETLKSLNSTNTNYLLMIQIIEIISKKIISFLGQIEDFQKKLFEKMKFVIKTEYFMTIDKIPEDFYDEIIKNEKMINHWIELFRIKNSEKEPMDDFISKNEFKINNSYLKSNSSLVLDTRFFDNSFKEKLLASINDLDKEIDGELIKSENLQALNLLMNKYKSKIKCIYIDPPYNTGSDDFIYKDNFQHSSWLSMMNDRLQLAKEFLRDDGVVFISINDSELNNLKYLMNDIFGHENFVAQLIWENREGGGSSDSKHFKIKHEYILTYAKNRILLEIKGLAIDNEERYTYEDEFVKERGKYLLIKLNSASIQYSKSLDYPIIAPDESEIVPSYDKKQACWRWSKEKVSWGKKNGFVVIKKDSKGKWAVYTKQYIKVDNENKPIHRTKRPMGVISEFSSTMATKHLEDLFGGVKVFDYSKPFELIHYLLSLCTEKDDIIMDFFAGSGTTAEAILQLNSSENKKRKYIIIDMGEHFDSVILPRLQKVSYSLNWKEGLPSNKNGVSNFVKYLKIEQYEDTLNNIEFNEDNKIQTTLDKFEDYFLVHMLNYDANNNSISLNLNNILNPFDYKMKITEFNDLQIKNIDLVETFNYLLGLKINKTRTYENNATSYRVIFGEREGSEVVIIWRNIEQLDLKKDKEFIENHILKNVLFDTIYINGNSYIKDAILIDEKLKTLMRL